MTVKQVYEVVKEESFEFDAIYEDFIMELVGSDGLEILLKTNFLRLVELLTDVNYMCYAA